MGYAGRMAPEKGVHLLLQAAAGLGGEWRLRILGSGPEQTRLRALVGESAVLDRVEFLPAVPHAEVAAFLRTLDVLVLPSLTTRSWAEQFGHVLIEAMSAETPVVASNSGAIPEVVGEAGLLFPEGDVSALKEALARLRDDPDLSGALGERGRKRVLERFTWDRIAGKTLELYRSLLSHENPPSLAGGGGSARAEPVRSGRIS
jgi:glycosyltransferase involved in cell wall biosynthesis